MQKLLHYICEEGFEHHVAANLSTVAAAVHEAATKYLGWEMYGHGRDNGESSWRLWLAWISEP